VAAGHFGVRASPRRSRPPFDADERVTSDGVAPTSPAIPAVGGPAEIQQLPSLLTAEARGGPASSAVQIDPKEIRC
jgi:hypothetical protein